jgi:predicted ATP-grasp superfamily ATP-dependent carboligase
LKYSRVMDKPSAAEVLRPLPPVIVLGIDTPIGLTVVRELGERGVPVHGIARSREGVGLYSRWLFAKYMRPSSDQTLLELLAQIRRDHGAKLVMAISERDLFFLRAASDADQLRDIRPLVPERNILQIVGDKVATCAMAEKVGVPVPLSWQPCDGDTVDAPPPSLTFPCVLKWRNPEDVQADLARLGVPFLKAEYCYDLPGLTEALSRYRKFGRYPLVQEFCPGSGLGHMIFMYRGEPLLKFQHRRLSEWPPEGGVSTVCESVSLTINHELLEKSVALLRQIRWEGAAMVEYRYDERTGRAALMEINGRFWGSLPLAYHAGAPFAWFTYAVLGLGRTPKTTEYRSGMVCRYMIPETRRLLTVMFQPRKIQNRNLALSPLTEFGRYLVQFILPKTRYYVFQWRDPKPFLADMTFLGEKLFGRVRRILIGR